VTSFLNSMPGSQTAAGAGVTGILSSVASTNAAAGVPQNAVVPMAPEPASILLASQFMLHGALYQSMMALADAVLGMHSGTLVANDAAYVATDAGNMVGLA
jgi:hypothetical protein